MNKEKPCWVKILWGEMADVEDTYYFDTEKEMEAFLDGVEEGNGWLNYEILTKYSNKEIDDG